MCISFQWEQSFLTCWECTLSPLIIGVEASVTAVTDTAGLTEKEKEDDENLENRLKTFHAWKKSKEKVETN